MATWPLVGQAIADGLLDLDAPMAHYFPGSYPGSKVTIRQILTYTCRLSPVTWLERYVGTDQPLAEAILVEELEKPGYCVTDRGFILLGSSWNGCAGNPWTSSPPTCGGTWGSPLPGTGRYRAARRWRPRNAASREHPPPGVWSMTRTRP